MTRTTTGALVDALTYPVRVLGGGLVEDDDASVRVEEDAYLLEVELRGYDCGNFELTWEDGELLVRAECDGESYEESFRFPDVVDPNAITATYRDDRLTVRLPVRGRAGAGTSIPVRAD